MALLLLEAGADPMYTCTTADGCQSLPPLTAVMHAIPTGEQALITHLLSPVQTDVLQQSPPIFPFEGMIRVCVLAANTAVAFAWQLLVVAVTPVLVLSLLLKLW